MTTTLNLDKAKILELLSQNKLKELFISRLGWNNFNQKTPIKVDDITYELNGIAEKEGFAIFEYKNNESEPLKAVTRKRISNQLSKIYYEHLLIFTEKNVQIWQRVNKATKDTPMSTRTESYYPAYSSGERLYQKLANLFFGWDDYTISDVTRRFDDTNKDKVTKKFYEEFKKNKDNFSKFIEGIKETVDQEWYSSLMLNRLMFIYFIQKKGFLNNDLNYMRNKLNEIQEKRGDNKFYSFYREFLLVLFHEGFAKELDKRSPEAMQIIGKIPYLNGGLFDVHELERKYTDITIPDEAFKKIFDFFDQYDWHLDDRPVSDDKQINPDVIGHIFEKYINQKQMGAYYTKEDITEYISKNTIIPYLFEEAKKKCEVAFKENSYIWQMLKDNPDKYIYEAVKKGCDKDLPENIAKGIKDVSQREKWNKPTLEEYALPTEIWRETVERRNRYFEVKSKLGNGEIKSINDFITYNLDIRQFVEDIITKAESADVVKAFYYTIAGHIGEKSNEKDIPAMSILDPTCGSGAFLFAGLNILEPLYSACIDRMEDFKAEKPDSYKEFDRILEDIEKHPNREYFIYKSIILNNLYGVDIMKEATEIAKLRLFLKLASCAEVDYRKDNFGLEALPDIDFNIRAGNSLVGFADYDEVKYAVEHNSLSGQMNLLAAEPMKNIEDKVEVVAQAYKRFKEDQIIGETSHDVLLLSKRNLQERLSELNDELNHYMAIKYGINNGKEEDYKKWLKTHEPFNWFSEFYDVIHNRGGFDVIIGNPPYVEYGNKIKEIYTIKNYKSEECGNLYGFVVERSNQISKNNSGLGFIIPISSIASSKFSYMQNLYRNSKCWISNYAATSDPGILFVGVKLQLSIFILHKDDNLRELYSTGYKKWYIDERKYLFENLSYEKETEAREFSISKIKNYNVEKNIIEKVFQNKQSIINYSTIGNDKIYYKKYGNYFWKIFLDYIPFFDDGVKNRSGSIDEIGISSKRKYELLSVLSSTTFYMMYMITSDCRNMTKGCIEYFRYENDNIELRQKLNNLGMELVEDIKSKSTIRVEQLKSGGTRKNEIFNNYNKSKSIIDQIDKVLAKHYGFTDEELDYIINYDIKYRMGDSLNGGDNDKE